jgi:hypothetical protein
MTDNSRFGLDDFRCAKCGLSPENCTRFGCKPKQLSIAECKKLDIADEMADGKLDEEYGAYIMEQTPIGNGDMLIRAMESGRFEEGFTEYLLGKRGSQ